MTRIPFGIRRLDTTIGGGAPSGSVVLLSGEAGAGGREFMYTSAVMNGLEKADESLFDLYYGDIDPAASVPEEVHYISFTSEERQVTKEMSLAMDSEIVESGLSAVEFHDLSAEFFRLSPVPRDWYANRTVDIQDLGHHQERRTVPEALGDLLTQHASGNLVVIDSLTDLIGASSEDLDWRNIPVLLKGIARAAFEWEGMVLVYLNHETLPDREHGQLIDAADGTLMFEWESGGSARARTMFVRQFRGVLSRVEEENIVRFETDIGDAGFDISDVRKIR